MNPIKNIDKFLATKPLRKGFVVLCHTALLMVLFVVANPCAAQENYEIQVYASPTMDKGATMVELHSNFNFEGARTTQDGMLPTHHVFHETIEITHGFTSWFETGFYLFNAVGLANQTSVVGSHIRPRVMVPESWHLPLGLSLSAEFGYQKLEYSTDDWSIEIRPIIDKTWGKFYLSFNPVFDKSVHGMNKNGGFDFAPNAKTSYMVSKKVALGLEYYGATGPLDRPDPVKLQQHQLFVAADLDLWADWELNAGYGLGLTAVSEQSMAKIIVGYKFHRGTKKGSPAVYKAARKYLKIY